MNIRVTCNFCPCLGATMGSVSMGGSRSSIPISSSSAAAGAKRGSKASILTADESKKPAAGFGGGFGPRGSLKEPESTLSPQVNALHNKWKHVWLMSMDRRRKLQVGPGKGVYGRHGCCCILSMVRIPRNLFSSTLTISISFSSSSTLLFARRICWKSPRNWTS